MNSIYPGILLIIISAIGYYFAWRFNYKGKETYALLLLIACGLLLRVFASADPFLHSWDERYHALVAKNLIKHPFIPTLYDNPILPFNYKSWVENHIWLHKQPFPLWIMALSMYIFGVNEFALRLPSVILSTVCIYLVYYIGRYLFNKNTAFIAAFLFSINGLVIELTAGRTATDHIDIFFLFFITLAVYFSIKFVETNNRIFNIFVGLSIGLAVLSKWLPAFIVFPIWLLLVINSKNYNTKKIFINFSIVMFVSFIIFLPWQIYIFNNFPMEASWEREYNRRHIFQFLEGHNKSFYYFFNKLGINYGEIIYLPLIWFIYKTFSNLFSYKKALLLVWFIFPLIFFTFVKAKMEAYILFTSPALLIITAIFFEYIRKYAKKFRYKFIPVLILILLIALPVRYSLERIKPFKGRQRPEWMHEMMQLKPLSDQVNGKLVIFNTPHPVETMFYLDCVAYSFRPSSAVVEELQLRDYKVVIK